MSLEVSVVIPVKDEEPNIAPLAREIEAAFAKSGLCWECLWVDDGSRDGSGQALARLAEAGPPHRLLTLAANCGQSAALLAGFAASRGRVIATLDGDGQNDPADLPAMVLKVLCGEADMVNGFRAARRDSRLRRAASRLANGARNAVTGKTVRDVGCSTRAFRRECAATLPAFRGMHRFLPTLAAYQGFRLAESPVNHRPRQGGKSKYTINNRLWVGLLDLAGVWWLGKRAAVALVAGRLAAGPGAGRG